MTTFSAFYNSKSGGAGTVEIAQSHRRHTVLSCRHRVNEMKHIQIRVCVKVKKKKFASINKRYRPLLKLKNNLHSPGKEGLQFFFLKRTR